MKPATYERGAAAFDFFNQPSLAPPRKRAFVESAARILPPGARVCDAGGGTGLYAKVLLEVRPDLRLTLVEPCTQMLELARQRLPESVQFVPATIQEALKELPPQDAFFFIRCLYAMEEDAMRYERLFRDLASRLAADGLVCIYDPRRPIDVAACEALHASRCAELGLSAGFALHWEEFRRQMEEYNQELAAGRIAVLDHLQVDAILQSLHFRKLVLVPDIQVYQYGLSERRLNAATDLCEFHCLSHGDEHYLFNVETSGAFRISEALARRLEGLRHTGGEVTGEALIRALGALELIRRPDCGPQPEPAPGVAHMMLNVSQDCNLACIYCYGGEGEYGRRSVMDGSTAVRAVDWLIENSGQIADVDISFFGGEPLLRFDLMQAVVDYARRRASAAGKNITFGVTTNGTLLTDERVRYLKANGVRINLSYDGLLQDRQRPFKSGAPTSPVVRQAAATVARHYGSDFRVTSTVAEPVDLDAMERDLDGIGCERSFIRAASPTYGEGSRPVPPTLGACFAAHIDALVEENLERIRRRQPPRDTQFQKVLGMLLNRGRLTHFCGAGRGLLAVATNGEIYPCHRFNGMEEFRMGTVAEFDAASCRPYHEATVDSAPACRGCWVRYFCGGGCHYDNRNNPEHRNLPPKRICDQLRHTVAAVIRLFARLDAADREFLRSRLKSQEVEDPALY